MNPARKSLLGLGLLAVILLAVMSRSYISQERAAAPAVRDSSPSVTPDTLSSPTAAQPRLQAATGDPEPELSGETAPSTPAEASAATTGPLVIFGQVTDEGGTPLEEATVLIGPSSREARRIKTDEQGNFTLRSDRPVFQLSASFTDCFIQTRMFPEPLRAGKSEQNFQLVAKQIIRIRLVTSLGGSGRDALLAAREKPYYWGLVPIATREDPGQSFTDVTSSLSHRFGVGRFRPNGQLGRPDLGPDHYGILILEEEGAAWVSLVAGEVVLEKYAIDESTDELVFTLDPTRLTNMRGTLQARVLAAEDGSPLAAQAWLEEIYSANTFVVGPDGEILRDGVIPGANQLILKADGRVNSVRDFTLLPGQVTNLGDVLMHRPLTISGYARSEDGSPVQTQVRWGRLDDETGRVDWEKAHYVPSDKSGAFEIPSVEPGIWILLAPQCPTDAQEGRRRQRLSRPLRVDTREGSVSNVNLTVYPTVKVTVRTTMFKRPFPVLSVQDDSGLELLRRAFGYDSTPTVLYLPMGTLNWISSRADEEIERRQVTVGFDPLQVAWPGEE
jgi:hypothetical protein